MLYNDGMGRFLARALAAALALLPSGCGSLTGSSGSCDLASNSSCIDYGEGFDETSARKACSTDSGLYAATACAVKGALASCVVTSKDGQVSTTLYYATGTMTVAGGKAACAAIGGVFSVGVTAKGGAGSTLVTGRAVPPEGAPASARSGASVYVEGQHARRVTTEPDGMFEIAVDTDTHPIVLSAARRPLSIAAPDRSAADAPSGPYGLVILSKDKAYGKRIDLAAVPSALGDVALGRTGPLTGKVELHGGGEPSQTQVSLPGTTFLSLTATDGSYSIGSVAPGTYPLLRAEREGYAAGFIARVEALDGADSPVLPLKLMRKQGDVPLVLLNGAKDVSASRKVELVIAPPPGAAKMMVSEDPNFREVAWKGLTTTIIHEFPKTGPRTLYVKFLDLNGVESAPVSGSVTISPGLGISPAERHMLTGRKFTFVASNGVPPYAYSIASGGGSVTSSGELSVSATAGDSVVRVTDSEGNAAEATVHAITLDWKKVGPNEWDGAYSVRIRESMAVAATGSASTSTFGSIPLSRWLGSVLAPNGKIYGIPYNGPDVIEVDPANDSTSTFGNLGSLNAAWWGGVLAPNGKIYGIPALASAVLEIDPVARTASTFGSLPATSTTRWIGGVLAPNGKIYGIPYHSSSVLEIDPAGPSVATFGSFDSTVAKWFGGVLGPNGKVYGIPHDSSSVLEIDPATRATALIAAKLRYRGGVLAPNGKIYAIPGNATRVLEIDVWSQTTSEIGATFSNVSGATKWHGGVLAPNGKIYGIPENETRILEIDPAARTSTAFGALPSTLFKWYGGTLAPNGRIYSVPYNGGAILKVVPPGDTAPELQILLSPFFNKL